MQLQLTSTFWAGDLGLDSFADGMALLVQGGAARLVYSEQQLNAAMSLPLSQVNAPGSGYLPATGLADETDWSRMQPSSGMAFQDTGSEVRAFVFDAHAGALKSCLMSASGAPGAMKTVDVDGTGSLSNVETFSIIGGAGGSDAALTTYNTPGFALYQLANDGGLTLSAMVQDTAKSYVANVSDTASLRLGGVDYLLTLSSLENGLTCYSIGADHKAVLNDSLGTQDGLYVAGPAAMQIMQMAGVTYAVIAATGSSSLSVVRINDMGCLFMTDHIIDDLTTRFEHPEVLDTFTAQGRSFVVSAGTDAGISILEMTPDGHLNPFYAVALETGAGLANVTGLEVALDGTTLQIFTIEARADRVQQFEVNLATLGGTITAAGGSATGTAKDDLIWGSSRAETLTGGAGDDFIFGGGGGDLLWGGVGMDVFHLDVASGTTRIADYEAHHDRIDLSEWGHIYDISALTITATTTGATVFFNGHGLTITSDDGRSLAANSFTNADFAF